MSSVLRLLIGIVIFLIGFNIGIRVRSWINTLSGHSIQAEQPLGCPCPDSCRGCCCCSDDCKNCCCNSKASPFAQQRLAALLDVASAFSKVTAVYFKYAKPDVDCWLDEEAGEAMAGVLRDADPIISRSEILFPAEFSGDVERFAQIFNQLNRLSITVWHEHRVFIADLYAQFDEMCRYRIAVLEGKNAAVVRMPLAAIPYAERIKMGAADYLDAHRKHWERQKKKVGVCIMYSDTLVKQTPCPRCGQKALWPSVAHLVLCTNCRWEGPANEIGADATLAKKIAEYAQKANEE